MLKKTILIILFFLYIISVSFAYTNISTCNHNANIQGEEYRVNQNITSATGNCINITANNITLDCQNYQITGSGSDYGIFLNTINNSIVKNCKIDNFQTGIVSSICYFSNINNNNITNSAINGILLSSGSNNSITINYIDKASINPGIKIFSELYDTVNSNTVTNISNSAILISNSDYCTVVSNLITYSNRGIELTYADNNNLISNIIEYSSVAAIHLDSSDYNYLYNNIIRHNSDIGLHLYRTAESNTINANNIYNNTNYDIYFSKTLAANYPVTNTLTLNIISNSSKIGTDTGTWTGYDTNNFTQNYYQDFNNTIPFCFIDGTACDDLASSPPISQATPTGTNSIFSFQNKSILVFITTILFGYLFLN